MSQLNKTTDQTALVNADKPGITTIFFDMGATLARIAPGWEGVYQQVFQKAGYKLPLGEVEKAISDSWAIVADQDETTAYVNTLEGNRAWQREVEERVMERLNIHPTVREDIFWKIIQGFEDSATYQLYPDVLSTLEAVKQAGYRLAIISNWSWHLPELCESLGLTPYFEQIITSARVGYAKPHPRIYEYALEELMVAPVQAVHIGDSYRADVVGASRLGIQPLWLRRPGEAPLYTDGMPEFAPVQPKIIEGLSEVVSYLGINV